MTEPTQAEFDAMMATASAQRAQLLVDRIRELTADNDAKLAEVRRSGAQISETSLFGVRLMVMQDFLLGGLDGSPAWCDPEGMIPEFPRLALELAVQERYAAQLDPLLSQVRQAALLAGTGAAAPSANGSKLIVPGR